MFESAKTIKEGAKQIDLKYQLQGSMIALVFMMIGVTAMAVYLIVFSSFSGWMKFLTGFNTFWVVVMFLVQFIGTYQQYKSYMEVQDTMKALGQGEIQLSQIGPQKVSSIKELKGGKK